MRMEVVLGLCHFQPMPIQFDWLGCWLKTHALSLGQHLIQCQAFIQLGYPFVLARVPICSRISAFNSKPGGHAVFHNASGFSFLCCDLASWPVGSWIPQWIYVPSLSPPLHPVDCNNQLRPPHWVLFLLSQRLLVLSFFNGLFGTEGGDK